MSAPRTTAVLWLAATLLAPAPAAALQSPSDGLRAMVREFVALEERFVRVQDEALDSFPSLREEQDELAATVERVMEELDPGVLEARERLELLPADLNEATRMRNVGEARRLIIESEQTRERVEVAQARAMASEEVFDATQAYRAELLQRMQEIDPEILSVLVRIHDLREEIRTARAGGPPSPPDGSRAGG